MLKITKDCIYLVYSVYSILVYDVHKPQKMAKDLIISWNPNLTWKKKSREIIYYFSQKFNDYSGIFFNVWVHPDAKDARCKTVSIFSQDVIFFLCVEMEPRAQPSSF